MKFRKPRKANRFLHSIQLGLRLLPTVEPGFKEILKKKDWNREFGRHMCSMNIMNQRLIPVILGKSNSALTFFSIEQSPVTRHRTRCTTGLIPSDNSDVLLYPFLSLQIHDAIRIYQ